MADQQDIDNVKTVFRGYLDLTAYYKAKAPLPDTLTIELTELYFQNRHKEEVNTLEAIVGMIDDYYTKVLKKPVLSREDVAYCLKQLMEEGTRKMASHRTEKDQS